jgi:hypothetical protein
MLKRFYNSIQFYKTLDFLQLFAILVSVFNALMSVTGYFNKNLAQTDKFVILGLIALGFVLSLGLAKLQAVNINRFTTTAEESYIISRLIRDGYQRFLLERDQGHQNRRIFDLFKSTSQQFVNSVRNVISKSVGENVSVCIKIFSLPEGHPSGPEHESEYQVKTICRSDKAPPERTIDNIVKVNQYKALKEIMVERRPHFVSTDLDSYNREAIIKSLEPYFDHSEDDWGNYYKSLIVVPIRINVDCNGSYKYLGFLWVDSSSKAAFRNDKYLKHHIEHIKSFADQFSHYLDRFYETYGSV